MNYVIRNCRHSNKALPAQILRAWAESGCQLQGANPLLEASHYLKKEYGLVCQLLQHFCRTHSHLGICDQSVLLDQLEEVFLGILSGKGPSKLQPTLDFLKKREPEAATMLRMSVNTALAEESPRNHTKWLESDFPCLEIPSSIWNAQEDRKEPPSLLSKSQEEAAVRLEGFWKLQQLRPMAAGIRPRTNALLVGPSGVGKTHVVREFANKHDLPMIDVNVGSWIVVGARTDHWFVDDLADFVDSFPKGLLFIDEVDKLSGTSDWCRCIQQEAFAILDRRTDCFSSWDTERSRKFRENFLIVGAGTWQDLQPSRLRQIGFHDDDGIAIPTQNPRANLDFQRAIPEELLFRFNADIVWLDPLTFEELRARIMDIYLDLDLPLPDVDRLEDLAFRAVASGKQHRWLEALVSKLALRSHYKNSKCPTCTGSVVFSSGPCQ